MLNFELFGLNWTGAHIKEKNSLDLNGEWVGIWEQDLWWASDNKSVNLIDFTHEDQSPGRSRRCRKCSQHDTQSAILGRKYTLGCSEVIETNNYAASVDHYNG